MLCVSLYMILWGVLIDICVYSDVWQWCCVCLCIWFYGVYWSICVSTVMCGSNVVCVFVYDSMACIDRYACLQGCHWQGHYSEVHAHLTSTTAHVAGTAFVNRIHVPSSWSFT